MDVRLRILEYIKSKGNPSFSQMSKDLELRTEIVARELKILIEQGYVVAYPDATYLLTPSGLRELSQLKGEFSHE